MSALSAFKPESVFAENERQTAPPLLCLCALSGAYVVVCSGARYRAMCVVAEEGLEPPTRGL